MDEYDYLSPKRMLQLYRECPDEWLQDQARALLELSPAEQAELHAYIAADHSRMVQYLHRSLIPAVIGNPVPAELAIPKLRH